MANDSRALVRWHKNTDGTWVIVGPASLVKKNAQLTVHDDILGLREIRVTWTTRTWTQHREQWCYGHTRSVPGVPDINPGKVNAQKTLTYTFYVLMEPDSDTVRYVGQTTVSLERRLQEHLTIKRYKRFDWMNGLLQMGKAPRIFAVDRRSCDLNTALDIERRWIRTYTEKGCDLLNESI